MVRSKEVLLLTPADQDLCARVPGLADLLSHPAFSAFCCLQTDRIIMERAAQDFSTTAPHSIQSISKLHIHLIIGWLLQREALRLDACVSEYLPDIGSGYADATVQSLLNMSVQNDFTEDYQDPNSDCYAEEIALGWRLPAKGQTDLSLAEFTASITGLVANAGLQTAEYKSANTDVLTLIAASVSPIPLAELIEKIADAAGYEGAFHISLSKDGHPAFSGGGCLSARDLARFGLLLAREGRDPSGVAVGNARFLQEARTQSAPALKPPKGWLRYSNHVMTDGRVIGHAGYGGQFLMVDTMTGTSCAFLSVLENDAGYDDDYMAELAMVLRSVCVSVS